MPDSTLTCPRCNSNQIVKNGKIHNGSQNFKCKACSRLEAERLRLRSLSKIRPKS